jgi:hypothetical protein
MKTSAGALVLLGMVLTAGLALAQTPPQPQPHGGPATAEPDGEAGQTRATVNQSGGTLAMERGTHPAAAQAQPAAVSDCDGTSRSGEPQSSRTLVTSVSTSGGGGTERSNRDHIDQDAQRGSRTLPSSTGPTSTPGTVAPRGLGGGRYTFQPSPIINNSESDTGQVEGAPARPGTGSGSRSPATPACPSTPTGRR